MSNLKASYQHIREELVSLSVELEERGKVCELLRKRLDEERYSTRNIDDERKRDLDQKMRDLVSEHRANMAVLIKKSTEFMESKRVLIERCQELVAEVADVETELGRTIQSIREDGRVALEKDKKLFRAGAEDRKAKALADKMGEVKAETRRAMEPEFQRLRRHHDTEMSSLLARLASEEKDLRNSYEKLLRDRMADEERAWKTSSQIRDREVLESASHELQALEGAHKEDMLKLSRKLRAELDAHKSALSSRAESDKGRLKSALKRVQDENDAQLAELGESHRRGVEQLHADHEEAVRRLRARDQAARAAADRQHEADMSAASSAMSRRGAAVATAEASGCLAERDARVQSEIRRLQTETVKLERAMKSKINTEKKAVAEAAEREIDVAERSHSRAQAEVSELAVQKEALLAAVQRSSAERAALREQRLDLESERAALEDAAREAEEGERAGRSSARASGGRSWRPSPRPLRGATRSSSLCRSSVWSRSARSRRRCGASRGLSSRLWKTWIEMLSGT